MSDRSNDFRIFNIHKGNSYFLMVLLYYDFKSKNKQRYGVYTK